MKASDKVYNMLSAQYKPLEEMLFYGLEREGRLDLIEEYKKGTSAQKIKVLDRLAEYAGL